MVVDTVFGNGLLKSESFTILSLVHQLWFFRQYLRQIEKVGLFALALRSNGMKPNKCVGLRCRLTQPTKNGEGIVQSDHITESYATIETRLTLFVN
jgi:hypothetical protein